MQKQNIGRKIAFGQPVISIMLMVMLFIGLMWVAMMSRNLSKMPTNIRAGNGTLSIVASPILSGNYVGTVAIDKPLALGILDLSLAITDTNGTLSGVLDNRGSLAFPQAADLQGRITGQIAGITTTFRIDSAPFTSTVSGRQVARFIQIDGTVEDDGNVIRGVYTETISGFTPQPLLVNGNLLASRAAPVILGAGTPTATPTSTVISTTPTPTSTATSMTPTSTSTVTPTPTVTSTTLTPTSTATATPTTTPTGDHKVLLPFIGKDLAPVGR